MSLTAPIVKHAISQAILCLFVCCLAGFALFSTAARVGRFLLSPFRAFELEFTPTSGTVGLFGLLVVRPQLVIVLRVVAVARLE